MASPSKATVSPNKVTASHRDSTVSLSNTVTLSKAMDNRSLVTVTHSNPKEVIASLRRVNSSMHKEATNRLEQAISKPRPVESVYSQTRFMG